MWGVAPRSNFRVKRSYRKEFRRVWQMWEESKSTAGADLDLRIRRVRSIHETAWRVASHVRTLYGRPARSAGLEALERPLLEPWAQRLLQMTADDVLEYGKPGAAGRRRT